MPNLELYLFRGFSSLVCKSVSKKLVQSPNDFGGGGGVILLVLHLDGCVVLMLISSSSRYMYMYIHVIHVHGLISP